MRLVSVLLAACLAAVALTACSDGADRQDAIATIEDVDGVAEVVPVLWEGETDERYLRVVLEDGLSEEQVRATVAEVKDRFGEDGAPDPGSLEVEFDGFRAGFYPRDVGLENADPDLRRALWAREDGRASSASPAGQFKPGRLSQSGSGYLVVAPAADVLDVALDVEAEVSTENEVRRSYRVGSADGSVRVQWSNYPGTLDRSVVEELAGVQDRYPGTTGWYDDQEHRVALYLDDADLDLGEALSRGPGLLQRVRPTEVGWGLLRAESWPELRRRARELGPALAELDAMPGVRAVTDEGVQVEDLATLDAVRRLLPDTTVQLVREPSDLIGFEPEPVFEVGSYAEPRLVELWKQLSRVDGFRSIDQGLVLESDITDADLARLFALLHPRFAATDRVQVTVADPPVMRSSGGARLGELAADGTFTPFTPLLAPATDELVERITAAWAAAPAR